MRRILQITRYSIKNEILSPWVKFIWHIDAENADLYYKLLPTECIDVILNLASDMVYETEVSKITAPRFHINGLRSKQSFIRHEKTIHVFGISFFPFGLFPFVHKPIQSLQNQIADLFAFAPGLAENLSSAVQKESSREIVQEIENVLLSQLHADAQTVDKARIISALLAVEDDCSIRCFCKRNDINIKTLERMVLRFTGFTPKALRSVARFQRVGNQLVHSQLPSLTGTAYDNSFADQSHFTKEFGRYAGAPPHHFLSERLSVKENAEYIFL